MDAQLVTAIVGLATITLGGLGTLITVLIAWLARKLDTNTTLTKEAKEASNGRLAETLDRLSVERNLVVGLRAIIHERDDRLAYIVSRLPEAEFLMSEYARNHTRRFTEADELAAENRITGFPPSGSQTA